VKIRLTGGRGHNEINFLVLSSIFKKTKAELFILPKSGTFHFALTEKSLILSYWFIAIENKSLLLILSTEIRSFRYPVICDSYKENNL
jgi:hypothetical protein